jgi:hypothetical protein
VQTLGQDTKKAELGALKAKISEAYRAKDTKALAKLERQYLALIEEDRDEYAQGIVDKMFNEFAQGHKWVLKMQKMATEKFYVYSPIGRIRHLYAAMTEDKQIVSRQVRRGMNAPIQGFASEIAVKASRVTALSYYRNSPKIANMLGLEKTRFPFKFNRIVHDASYYTVPFEMVIPFIHILQYDTTYGVTQAYEKEFGLKFTVEPEIEIEVGVRDTASRKWGWSLPELVSHLNTAVDDGIQQGLYAGSKEEILGKIYAPWRNADVLDFLDTTYPLLGVSLKKEIRQTLKEMKC